MTFGGLESGPIFPEIIEIGAGKNLRVDVARDAAIKIGLAEETAINRIGQIVFIREFSRVDNSEAPSLSRGEQFDALGRLFWHRG